MRAQGMTDAEHLEAERVGRMMAAAVDASDEAKGTSDFLWAVGQVLRDRVEEQKENPHLTFKLDGDRVSWYADEIRKLAARAAIEEVLREYGSGLDVLVADVAQLYEDGTGGWDPSCYSDTLRGALEAAWKAAR